MAADITSIAREIDNIHNFAIGRDFDQATRDDMLPMALTITAVALLIIGVVAAAALTSGGSIGVVATVGAGPALLAGGLDLAMGIGILMHNSEISKAFKRAHELQEELNKYTSHPKHTELSEKVTAILSQEALWQ